jgi:hypothetical protein
VHHGFDQADLSLRAAKAGFAEGKRGGTRDYPVFLMTARRAGA